MSTLSLKIIGTIALLAMLASPLTAYAASGNSGGDNNNSQNQNNSDQNVINQDEADTPTCKKGYVYSKKKKECVKMGSELIPDKDLYTQGRALALKGKYADALHLLSAIHRTDDSMVYTMIGFSKRKLGKFDEGMAMYKKALVIDPNNPNTHEYMGEAYISIGRIDLAELELGEVEKGCGNQNCEQFADLSKAIQAAKVE